jgi:hypothetical protein
VILTRLLYKTGARTTPGMKRVIFCKETDDIHTGLLATAFPHPWLPSPLSSESGRPSSRTRRRRRRKIRTCLEFVWNTTVVLVAEKIKSNAKGAFWTCN